MKKYLLKKFLGGIVFFGAGAMIWALAGWSGNYGLEVSGEEVLTADKWNTLVQNLGGVKMKYYDGTTNSSSITNIEHGMDVNNILAVKCFVYHNTYFNYRPMDYYGSGNARFTLFDATNIKIDISNATSTYGGQKYKCVLFYK